MQEMTNIKMFLEDQWKCRATDSPTTIKKQSLGYITERVDEYYKQFGLLSAKLKNTEMGDAELVKTYFNAILKKEDEAYKQCCCYLAVHRLYKRTYNINAQRIDTAFEKARQPNRAIRFNSQIIDHHESPTTMPVSFERPALRQQVPMWDPNPQVAQVKQENYRRRFAFSYKNEQGEDDFGRAAALLRMTQVKTDRSANYADVGHFSKKPNAIEALQSALARSLTQHMQSQPNTNYQFHHFVSTVFDELLETLESENRQNISASEIEAELIRGVDAQYGPVEETFTYEQMQDVVRQRHALRTNALHISHYDYANYDSQLIKQNVALFKQQRKKDPEAAKHTQYQMSRLRLPTDDPNGLETMKTAIRSIMQSSDVIKKIILWNAELRVP